MTDSPAVLALARNPSRRGEADDFTLSAYAEALDLAKRHYRFVNYGNPTSDRHVIWRHDIDYSPDLAVRTARIEADLGVRCVYHVLVSSRYYNVLDRDVASVLGEIRELGHFLGLHFDMDVFGVGSSPSDGEFEDRARLERGLLETCVGAQVDSISFHNFGMHRSRLTQLDRIAGLANACAIGIQDSYRYVSDSNGIWRFDRLLDVLAEPPADRMHVLTHPIWWTETAMKPIERIRRFLDSAAESHLDAYIAAMRRDGRLSGIRDRVGLSDDEA